jgi:hypothetical protein
MPTDPTLIHDVLRGISRWEPSELPVVTAYLDLRPDTQGSDPTTRPTLVLLRDRFQALIRPLKEHTPAYDSIRADQERIEAEITSALPETQAVAFFACAGEQRFMAVEIAPGLESTVTAGPLPDLLPLARLASRPTAVMALYDTSTLRLFSTRAGRLTELPGLDENDEDYGRHLADQGELGGRVDEHRLEFARTAAERIERAMRREGADVLVLAGDQDVGVPLLRSKLPKRIADQVRTQLSLMVRASWADIEAALMPALDDVRAQDARDAADTLMDEVGEQDLGVAGVERTREALERGQVLQLLISEDVPVNDEDLVELVRLAYATDAVVRWVPRHPRLAEHGVGALLRFRIDPDPAAPADAYTSGAGTTSSRR